MSALKQPQILLTLESIPCHVPLAIRLRSVLKRLLRTYGFRCTSVAGDALDDAKPQEEPQ
jgi:hypothetical protein